MSSLSPATSNIAARLGRSPFRQCAQRSVRFYQKPSKLPPPKIFEDRELVAKVRPSSVEGASRVGAPNVYGVIREIQRRKILERGGSEAEFEAVAAKLKVRRGSDEEFMQRLRADGGDKIVTLSRNYLHTLHTRFNFVGDQVKGLSLEQALLQLKWTRKEVSKKLRNALEEAIVMAREQGFNLSKTYVADVWSFKNEAVLSEYLAKRYIFGRGRYGATPQRVTTLLRIVLQERDRPFEFRERDPLEWVRERLREKQVAHVRKPDQIYKSMRQRRLIKEVYC